MTDSRLGKTVIRKIGWRILPILIAGYFFAYLDRVNIGFAAISMNQDIGLTPRSFGFVAGIFFIGYALFEVPSTFILNKVGARIWLARIMITWGVIACASAFSWSPGSMGVGRFALGLAEAGYVPGMISFLMAWLPNEYRGRFIGALLSIGVMSVVIGGPLSGAIMSLGTFGGLRSWQWLFILEGAPIILVGIATLVWLPMSPRDVAWLTTDEKLWLKGTFERERVVKDAVSHYGVADVLKSPVIWLVGAALFPIGVAAYSVLAFLPQAVKALGLTDFKTGVISASPLAITAVVMLWWSARSDRAQERPWHIFIPAVCGCIGLIVVAAVPPGLIGLFGVTLAASGLFSALAILYTLVPSYYTQAAATTGTALATVLANLGSFTGPYMTGWLREVTGGYQGALLVAAALMAVSAGIALTFKPPTDRKYMGRSSRGVPLQSGTASST